MQLSAIIGHHSGDDDGGHRDAVGQMSLLALASRQLATSWTRPRSGEVRAAMRKSPGSPRGAAASGDLCHETTYKSGIVEVSDTAKTESRYRRSVLDVKSVKKGFVPKS
eukprot:SAG11_NODE_9984_length_864_cov_34.713725_1_plen_109_part_00